MAEDYASWRMIRSVSGEQEFSDNAEASGEPEERGVGVATMAAALAAAANSAAAAAELLSSSTPSSSEEVSPVKVRPDVRVTPASARGGGSSRLLGGSARGQPAEDAALLFGAVGWAHEAQREMSAETVAQLTEQTASRLSRWFQTAFGLPDAYDTLWASGEDRARLLALSAWYRTAVRSSGPRARLCVLNVGVGEDVLTRALAELDFERRVCMHSLLPPRPKSSVHLDEDEEEEDEGASSNSREEKGEEEESALLEKKVQTSSKKREESKIWERFLEEEEEPRHVDEENRPVVGRNEVKPRERGWRLHRESAERRVQEAATGHEQVLLYAQLDQVVAAAEWLLPLLSRCPSNVWVHIEGDVLSATRLLRPMTGSRDPLLAEAALARWGAAPTAVLAALEAASSALYPLGRWIHEFRPGDAVLGLNRARRLLPDGVGSRHVLAARLEELFPVWFLLDSRGFRTVEDRLEDLYGVLAQLRDRLALLPGLRVHARFPFHLCVAVGEDAKPPRAQDSLNSASSSSSPKSDSAVRAAPPSRLAASSRLGRCRADWRARLVARVAELPAAISLGVRVGADLGLEFRPLAVPPRPEQVAQSLVLAFERELANALLGPPSEDSAASHSSSTPSSSFPASSSTGDPSDESLDEFS